MSFLGFFAPTRLTRLAALICLVTTLISAASAEEKAKDAAVIYPRAADKAVETSSAGSPGYSGILVAALLLAGAGGWLFWRGKGSPRGAISVRKLAIAETKSLGNRQYLVVASYENKKFLLGVCPGRIELLTPLDGELPPASS